MDAPAVSLAGTILSNSSVSCKDVEEQTWLNLFVQLVSPALLGWGRFVELHLNRTPRSRAGRVNWDPLPF